MKKILLPVMLAAAIGSIGNSAQAAGLYNEFQVDENSVPGISGASIFTADVINGRYFEKFRIYADPADATKLLFSTNAVADWNAFYKDDGTSDPLGIGNQTQLDQGEYDLWGKFSASGTVTADSNGKALFNATAANFELFIDANNNTGYSGFSDLSNINFTGVNTGDDYRIAYSNTLDYLVNVIQGQTGAFDLAFKNFTLENPAGTSYFIDPNPFHLKTKVDGDFDDFNATPGIFNVAGDLSAVFPVPEPTSLALLGIGMLGLGLNRRKQA